MVPSGSLKVVAQSPIVVRGSALLCMVYVALMRLIVALQDIRGQALVARGSSLPSMTNLASLAYLPYSPLATYAFYLAYLHALFGVLTVLNLDVLALLIITLHETVIVASCK
jgi:hypothetical protein